MKSKTNFYSRHFILLVLVAFFVMTCTLNLSGCKSQKNIKSIIGTYGPWKTQFEVVLMEEHGQDFKGVLKWKQCWTYCEGKFFAEDSIIFKELENMLGSGVELNGTFPGRITSDSIRGKWLHDKNPYSGNPYAAKIVKQKRSISNLENDVWELYKKEKTLKAEHSKLQNQVFAILRQAQEERQKQPPQTDSLESLRGKYAIELIESVVPFYRKYINSADSALIYKDLNVRLGANFVATKLDSSEISVIQKMLEQNPEGSIAHYRLSKILHDQKLRTMILAKKENRQADWMKWTKEFLLHFMDKKLHPNEELNYLFDFAYGVYQYDQSYYTALMERANRLREHGGDKNIDMLEKVITRIDQDSNISVGTLAPDFSTKSLTGQDITLSSFKGKVVCLEFWASWCGPCRTATPRLKEIQKQFSDRVVMLGIALEDSAAAKRYIDKNEIDWLNIAASGEQNKLFRDLYGINGIPTMFLIDKQGKIAHRLHPLDKDLKKKISDLL